MDSKQIIVLFVITLVAAVSTEVTFDTLEIEKILRNDELAKFMSACLLDQKPCGYFQGLRDSIAPLIKTNCRQCSPTKKKKYDHMAKVLSEKRPGIFNALLLKYSDKKTEY